MKFKKLKLKLNIVVFIFVFVYILTYILGLYIDCYLLLDDTWKVFSIDVFKTKSVIFWDLAFNVT